jgi:hypothetical protein
MHVEEVDLTVRGLNLPTGAIGMVVAQPFLKLTQAEPYSCDPEQRESQIAIIRSTLDIAKAASHGAGKTHFTVFPEYSIPGLEGVSAIDTELNKESWPTGTLVIGGIDGLSAADYRTLISVDFAHCNEQHNGAEKVQNQWVNCAVVWVKSAEGRVERWVQPKVAAAVAEWDTTTEQMFEGGALYLFRASFENQHPCIFFVLTCFDWIATTSARKPWQWVVKFAHERAIEANGTIPLTWAFVIQHNEKPSHPTFLREAADFFEPGDFASAARSNTGIVFANTAGRSDPGRANSHGYSSLVFSPAVPFADPACFPTYTMKGKRVRNTEVLGACKDVLFRENGACIHSFAQNAPAFLGFGAEDRKPPIQRPFAYAIPGTPIDPRTPNAGVSAATKWGNDFLDNIICLSQSYPQAPLANEISDTHRQNVSDSRILDAELARRVSLAAANSNAKNADDWGDLESAALETVVHTMDIIRIAFPNFKVTDTKAHATFVRDGKGVDLLAVRGHSHEACVKHASAYIAPQRKQVLVVSRDSDNNRLAGRVRKFLLPNAAKLGDETKITEPEAARVHIGYQDIFTAYLPAANAIALTTELNACFAR